MNRASDLTFAFRMIRRRPWFSAAIVVTLALGIGINTTVFSLVNAVLFKPLPFPGGDRLVMAFASQPAAGRDRVGVSFGDFRDFRQGQRSFHQLELFMGRSITLAETGNPAERFRGTQITAGMFDMLHTRPVLGRAMLPEDEKPGTTPAILLGYQVWKHRYGGSPTVLGRAVRANERPAVIIGVMPDGFRFPNNEEVWLSEIPDALAEKRDSRDYRMVGMLKPGVSIPEARADMNAIARRLADTYPATNKGYAANVLTFHEAMNGGTIRVVFLLMLGAVGFVLLIACANVANMLLGRAVERSGEISIRSALGASRWRLVRQLLVESIVLSVVGGMAGLAIARYGTEAFSLATADVGKPYWIDFSMNYQVFGYFAALTVVAGIIFGIAPALLASRVNLNESLKGSSRNSAGPRGGYLSGALVVIQFTLAVVLLSGAGLMMRSFLASQSEFAAIDSARILTARISLPDNRYPKAEDRLRFYEKLQSRMAAIPGAGMTALTVGMPGDGRAVWPVERQGRLVTDPAKRLKVSGVSISNGYLPLIGMTLLRGRNFNDADGLPGHEAVIVSRLFASRVFPNEDPLGREIRIYNDSGPRPWMTIVGISPDIRQQNLSEADLDPLIFVPYRFESVSDMALAVRTAGSPASLTTALRAAVHELDADLPLSGAMALDDLFGKANWHLRVFGTLFLIFAAVALGMAGVGVYGVMAHAASRRTREIGVRLALGANAGTILRLVLRRGVVQLGLGLTLGLTVAFAVCRLMRRLLFGVSPADPATFIGVSVTLAVIGFIAIWLPARRAARLNPVQALRHQ